MADSCPTVRVADDKAPDGFVVINEADYDAKTQRLYGEAPAKRAPAGKHPAAAANDEA